MSIMTEPTVAGRDRSGDPLRVVVVSCHEYAMATVRQLTRLDGVEVVGFMRGDLPRARLLVRIRRFWRTKGPAAVPASVVSIARKMWSALVENGSRPSNAVPGVPYIRVGLLDAPDAIQTLETLKPDLMIVDGASILKPDFFERPRYGAINLHCGKVPDYRGMPPAFWELYYGEREVGVSVHAVSSKLDEGAVFAAATVPLDLRPPGDPVAYATRFWLEQLRPVGIQLIAQVVRSIADGTARPLPQPAASRPPFRAPSFREKLELRRRVARRRTEGR